MQNPQQLTLSPVQLALYDALSMRGALLGTMYYGALFVLTGEANPERFSQCAQSLRELTQRLAFVQSDVNLGTKVKDLGEKWDKCKKNRPFSGDEAFAIMTAHLDVFFIWVDENRASRQKQAQKILDDLDPMFGALPKEIMGEQVATWSKFRKYFEQVTHHNHFPQELDFKAQVEAFSIFLLNLLRPKTSDNFAEIEKLIREGEADAE